MELCKRSTWPPPRLLLAKLVQNPEEEPVILMRGKKPIAVILPVGDADLETVTLSVSPTVHAILERSRRSAVTEGTYSSDELRREFGLPPYEDRRANARGLKPKQAQPMPKVRRAKSEG